MTAWGEARSAQPQESDQQHSEACKAEIANALGVNLHFFAINFSTSFLSAI
jgi:hypothetical protein